MTATSGPDPRPIRQPDLTHFVRGYAGPREHVVVESGTVRVVAALMYRGGIKLELFLAPPEDLSTIAFDPSRDSRAPRVLREGLPPHLQDELTENEKVWTWVHRVIDPAQLTDDAGTEYQSGPAGGGTYRRGLLYRLEYVPGLPASARTLTLDLGEAAISIDVSS